MPNSFLMHRKYKSGLDFSNVHILWQRLAQWTTIFRQSYYKKLHRHRNCVPAPWYRAKTELSPWWGALLWKRTYHGTNISRCSFISNAAILIGYLIFTKKRASNTVLLLIYGSLGLFLNVINGISLLKARDIHQQNCVPLKQVLREFENVTTQSFIISIIVWYEELPKNKSITIFK